MMRVHAKRQESVVLTRVRIPHPAVDTIDAISGRAQEGVLIFPF